MAGLKVREVDRIDVLLIGDAMSGKALVAKYSRGDGLDDSGNARDVLLISELVEDGFDVEGAAAWCAEHGFSVRRWRCGFRAWKADEPWPIRSAVAVQRMRKRLEREARERIALGQRDMAYCSMDLAYEG